jgi:hypothetical protein
LAESCGKSEADDSSKGGSEGEGEGEGECMILVRDSSGPMSALASTVVSRFELTVDWKRVKI